MITHFIAGSESTSLTDCDAAWKVLVQYTDIIVGLTVDPIGLARKLSSELVIFKDFYKRVKDKASRIQTRSIVMSTWMSFQCIYISVTLVL